ncbi:hypothetical protein EDD37DRAFT_626740 [Exophiala viscosa]|uniref:Zn(2)-C6 fungal-type domain-containing protein n=1 Tax=Exophiala viscosa TaxID=2486360 RepID=A0AAN6DXM0_9EURO|nr:hypothetical protein EDD36DRAFT_438577 [Exophiala viscosa]KAI1626230.1 hypothetical protein EDD37DRAFT_626740 [Exophiala viscosa]
MEVVVRTRSGISRSRNGCSTCKKRRVKCDEARPKCQRCRVSGHECQFDSSPSAGQGASVTFINYTPGHLQSQLTSHPNADCQELRALEFFHERSVPEIPGQTYTDLWGKYLLPMAHHEPALRHAMVALGKLHEGYLISASTNQYALHQYGKAINLITKMDSSSPSAFDTALASCVLFAAIETLMGHPRSSVMHVLSGMKILKQGGRYRDGFIPRDQLAGLFDRTACQALEIGDFETLSQSSPPEGFPVPDTFASTREAVRSLEAFQYYTLRLFQDTMMIPDSTMSAEEEKMALLAATLTKSRDLAGKWTAACERFLASETTTDHPAHLILRIMIEATYIQLNAPQECDFDQFTSRFKRITEWAEMYLRRTITAQATAERPRLSDAVKQSSLSTSTSSVGTFIASTTPLDKEKTIHRDRKLLPRPEEVMRPTFTMSSGVIPHLYMASARCRDPVIRRQALRLLRASNRREGLWDSQLTARVAERVMLIEEHNARRILGLQEDGPLTDCSQIHLPARITATSVQFGQNREGVVTYASRDPSAPRVQTTERISW